MGQEALTAPVDTDVWLPKTASETESEGNPAAEGLRAPRRPMLLAVASLGALSPSQLDELALEHCHGRVFLDGGSNTGDSVRSFLSGAPTLTRM